jgi:hypothetical protein
LRKWVTETPPSLRTKLDQLTPELLTRESVRRKGLVQVGLCEPIAETSG